jgi:hypothetical protein
MFLESNWLSDHYKIMIQFKRLRMRQDRAMTLELTNDSNGRNNNKKKKDKQQSGLKLNPIPSKIDGRKAMWAVCRKISDPEKPAPPQGNAGDDGNGGARFSSDEDDNGAARFSSDEDDNGAARFSSDEDDNGAARFSSEEENSVHDDTGGRGQGNEDNHSDASSTLLLSIDDMAIV